jgi:hypothetical protein
LIAAQVRQHDHAIIFFGGFSGSTPGDRQAFENKLLENKLIT